MCIRANLGDCETEINQAGQSAGVPQKGTNIADKAADSKVNEQIPGGN